MSVCDKCGKAERCTLYKAGCSKWRKEYMDRQRMINMYARFAKIQNPCEACNKKKSCNIPCQDRLAYWDKGMEKIWMSLICRKEAGGSI